MKLISLMLFCTFSFFGCGQAILNKNLKQKMYIGIYYSEFFGLKYKAEIIEYENGNGFCHYHSLHESKPYIALTEEDFDQFYKILDTISLMNIPQDTVEMGFDGTDIFIEIRQNEKVHKLNYWSPTFATSPKFCTLLQAINSILRKKNA
jgi:hypothetical protein